MSTALGHLRTIPQLYAHLNLRVHVLHEGSELTFTRPESKRFRQNTKVKGTLKDAHTDTMPYSIHALTFGFKDQPLSVNFNEVCAEGWSGRT